jgi:phytoene desaturase
MVQKKVIIIGAGIGGLSAACYLAKDGYDVTILEKNTSIGGRARKLEVDGYTFDMGPSWYLMPEVFDKFFADFGKQTSDYFALTKLDPMYRIYFGPREFLDISSNLEKNKELFESIEPGSSQKLSEYLKIAKLQYEIGVSQFVYRNYDSIFDFFQKDIMTQGMSMHIFESLENYVKRYFKSPKLQKIMQYTTVFLGGSPKNTPAMYSLMSHCDFNIGVFFPKGGIIRVVEGIAKLARELGVKIITDADVTQIELTTRKRLLRRSKGILKSVKANNGEYESDIVVANADYHFVDRTLLPKEFAQYSNRKWNSLTVAPSGFILYIGLTKKLPQLQHHTLFFDADWDDHFSAIFDKPRVPKEPSYYVSCVSASDHTVAPKNHEVLFFLVPMAAKFYLSEEQKKEFTEKLISHFESQIGESIKSNIAHMSTYDSTDFRKDYNAFGGTALGLAHTFMQTAVFRPRNKSTKVERLYYVGQNTVPGVGMPMVLISGKLVAQRVSDDERKN